MRRLSRHEAVRLGSGGVDRNGLLFSENERIYRALQGEGALVVQSLLDDPDSAELFAKGLVRFWQADVEVESFELVVEAERVPRVTYPTEWSTEMLRASAVMLARLASALADRGIGIKDPHPWNVLFDATRAIFVDLGSLVMAPTPTPGWRREFRRDLISPLRLHDLGLHAIADRVVQEHPTGPIKSVLDRKALRATVLNKADRLALRRSSPVVFYDRLAAYCEGLDASGTPMDWSEYDQKPAPVGDVSGYNAKQTAVHDFLLTMTPTTVLDLAANQGWYSELAVGMGHSVIATDIDDKAVGALFRRAEREHLDVLPLRLDLLWPRGSYGLGLAYSGPYERIRSEVVLALAVLHHLVRNNHITFLAFAQVLDRVADRAAIVEFIPRNDVHVATWGLGDWYDEDNFVDVMRAFFPKVTRRASSPEPRAMFLFER